MHTQTTPSKPGTASALDDYAALRLGPGSEFERELLGSVEEEHAAGGRITVTDDFGADPAGMTPRMMAWWKANIAVLRGRALAEIKARFEADTIMQKGVGRGVLVEAERARLDHERTAHRDVTIKAFWRRAEEAVTRRDRARGTYEHMAARHGRKPTPWRPRLYVAGILLILAMEMFLNFETFLDAPFIPSPFLALGATLLVASGIAAAAHWHGEVLKQWDHHFGPHDRTLQWQGNRKLAIGGTLLLASLTLVGGSRYYIVEQARDIAVSLGESPPSLLGSMTIMLMGNLIVYGLGVVWSFINHDQDPEYPKALAEMRASQAAFDRLHRTEMVSELDRADAKHAADCAALMRLADAQKHSANYAPNRDAYAQFCAVDSAAGGALMKYRAALVKALRQRGDEPVFEQNTVDREDGARVRTLTAEQFLAEPMTLKLL